MDKFLYNMIDALVVSGDVKGKRVLEVGSYNINGSIRPIFEKCDPSEYIGTDGTQGPGVDKQCLARNLVEMFRSESFDIVVSVGTLCQIKRMDLAILNMKTVLKTGGLLFLETRGNHYQTRRDWYHTRWNFSLGDVKYMFDDMEIIYILRMTRGVQFRDKDQEEIYLKARKPADFKLRDLSTYQVFNFDCDKEIPLGEDYTEKENG